ncbi:hypothetical protein MAIT1_01105 [Magnetofaba australis IT-1]|uniref:Uncharacterized protein n=1 Tax=Magnetofaba australis IT-1 TaxID=1434232 RepID=A0A1Y2K774_9PROT|nr:hypothetical protein MAIT1_01105 [Magnetofaba australis IT-1]
MLRGDKCNLFLTSQGRLLGIRGGWVFALPDPDAGHKHSLRPLFAIQGDCVLHGGIHEASDGWIYFGEYFRNAERGPVRIWRIAPDLSQWEIAHEFAPGQARHVHGVYGDPFDPSAIWAAVGDEDGECYLYCTRDRFAHVDQFGDGTQLYRAVRLFFTPKHICWLTDSNLAQNYACRLSRQDGVLEVGQKVDNSCWYGATLSDGLMVAFTTVEEGPGILSNESQVLTSRDGFHWQEAYRFTKDRWRPMSLFKFGVISCAEGPMPPGELYISGEALQGLEGRSGILRWEESA